MCSAGSAVAGGRTTFSASNFDDLFSMFGGQAGGTRFGGPTRGRDLTASTTLEFTTAIKGDTVKLEQQGGKTITVKIPAGVKDGQKIKLKGKGEPSPDGGEAGDLVLTVTVRKHPVFERDGNNLRVVVPVTFTEAALGATIEVPTLGGNPVKLKVAAGTPSGRILRVKGRGVQTAKTTGDLLAEVQVAVPSRLPDDAKEALEEFRKAMPDENPRDELLREGEGILMDEHSPMFPIAVAAELAGMHPQTLRQYDRLGLVSPGRTAGKSRRYSMRDVAQLREIARLSAEGLNLEGVRRILELENETVALRARVHDLEVALADVMLQRPGGRVFAAGSAGEVIPLRAGRRAQKQNQVVVWRPLKRG